MANEELIKEAKALGVENAESLNKTQLEKAIKSAKKEAEERKDLEKRYSDLGYDVELAAGFSNEDLKSAIDEAEADRAKKDLQEKKNELLGKVLLIEDFDGATVEAVEEALKTLSTPTIVDLDVKTKVISEALGVDFEKVNLKDLNKVIKAKVTIDEPTQEVETGRFTDSFAFGDRNFVFSKKAPAKFRFAGVVKTQEEWVKDKEAMELMISGNIAYVKLVND